MCGFNVPKSPPPPRRPKEVFPHHLPGVQSAPALFSIEGQKEEDMNLFGGNDYTPSTEFESLKKSRMDEHRFFGFGLNADEKKDVDRKLNFF